MIYILIGLIILFISAEVASFVYKIYFDKFYVVFHFVGGSLTYLLFLNLTKNRLLSLGLVLTIGILWEIYEWLLWKFFLRKRQFKPGGKDTKNDLLMDILGALLFYVIEVI